MAQPASDSHRYSYADYCSRPNDERWELIDGDAYAMSPAAISGLEIDRNYIFLAVGETG